MQPLWPSIQHPISNLPYPTLPIPPQPLLLILLQLIRRPKPLRTHLQRRIGMRIRRTAQTRIPQIIKPAIRDVELFEKSPNLGIMPVDNGVDAHERRPAAIRRVEVFQLRAVGICAPRADEDGADGGVVGQVVGEGFAHGFGVAREGEVVGLHAVVDESVDFGEGVGGYYVYGWEG